MLYAPQAAGGVVGNPPLCPAFRVRRVEEPRSDQGRPRCPTEAVVETLRFFVREGVQWRELRATGDRVCGATLRRRLMEWYAAALLRRVHAALVRMIRSGPEAAAAAWDV